MKVIGLVGEKGSGKQTFVNFLKQIATEPSAPRNDRGGEIASSRTPRNDIVVRQVRFSDILAQTLMIWDIPNTRSNLQKLSLVMEEGFGQSSLANAAKFSIEGDMADVLVFDGIRRNPELDLVKNMPNSTLIYITADQKLRYERLKLRSEKVGEVGLTYEQFLEEEKSKAEINIPTLGKKADKKIENDGSLEEFKGKIEQLFKL